MTSHGPEKHFYENWILPSQRISYVSSHTETRMAQLHDSSNDKIAPVWMRVTKTPW